MSALDVFLDFLPLLIMGFFCGFVRFARNENELLNTNDDEKKEIKIKRTRFLRGIDVILTSSISSAIIYALLSHFTNFNYLVKIAIAAAVALYGVDKILDLAHRIWDLRSKNANK